NYPNQGNSQK
ncbi:unnamed protein product, partial [Allacma fusca]